MFLNSSLGSVNRKHEFSALFVLLTVVRLVSAAENPIDGNTLLPARSAISLSMSSISQSILPPHPSRPQNSANKGEHYPNGDARSEAVQDSESESSLEGLPNSSDADAEPFPQIAAIPQMGASSQTGTEDWTQDGLQVGSFPIPPDTDGAGPEIILYSLQDGYCRGSVSVYCNVAMPVS